MTDTPTIDEQIAAMRRMCEGDTQPHTIREARAALATLEQHKLALAVVEAARPHVKLFGGDLILLRDALAAFDAGEKPR
jgi:hypothetical protein